MHTFFAIASLLSVACAVNAAHFTVTVGVNGTLRYEPQYVNAQMNDTIEFVFDPKNHTLTQSTYEQPCLPVPGGTDSGYKPNNGTGPEPTFIVTVTDNSSTWFHCAQKNPSSHCAKGMTFAINPDTDGHSFAEFQNNAIASGNTSASAVPSGTAAGTAAGPAASSGYGAGTVSSSGVGTRTTVSSSAATTSTSSSAKGNAAIKVGGSAAGALVMALLVGLTL